MAASHLYSSESEFYDLGSTFDVTPGDPSHSSLSRDDVRGLAPSSPPIDRVRSGFRPYRRGDFKSGRGRGGHEFTQPSYEYQQFPSLRGRRGCGWDDIDDNIQDYSIIDPPYQPRDFGSLSVEENPLFRPLNFVRSDRDLFTDKEEIFLPEIIDIRESKDAVAIVEDAPFDIFPVSSAFNSEVSVIQEAQGELRPDEKAPKRARKKNKEIPDWVLGGLPVREIDRKCARADDVRLTLVEPDSAQEKGRTAKTQSHPTEHVRTFIEHSQSRFQPSPMSEKKLSLLTELPDKKKTSRPKMTDTNLTMPNDGVTMYMAASNNGEDSDAPFGLDDASIELSPFFSGFASSAPTAVHNAVPLSVFPGHSITHHVMVTPQTFLVRDLNEAQREWQGGAFLDEKAPKRAKKRNRTIPESVLEAMLLTETESNTRADDVQSALAGPDSAEEKGRTVKKQRHPHEEQNIQTFGEGGQSTFQLPPISKKKRRLLIGRADKDKFSLPKMNISVNKLKEAVPVKDDTAASDIDEDWDAAFSLEEAPVKLSPLLSEFIGQPPTAVPSPGPPLAPLSFSFARQSVITPKTPLVWELKEFPGEVHGGLSSTESALFWWSIDEKEQGKAPGQVPAVLPLPRTGKKRQKIEANRWAKAKPSLTSVKEAGETAKTRHEMVQNWVEEKLIRKFVDDHSPAILQLPPMKEESLPPYEQWKLRAKEQEQEMEMEMEMVSSPKPLSAVPLTKAKRKPKRAEERRSAMAKPSPAKEKKEPINIPLHQPVFCEEEQQIRMFVEGGQSSFQLPPMGKQKRRLLKELAVPYNVTCKKTAAGKGMMGAIMLVRTIETKLVEVQEHHGESTAHFSGHEEAGGEVEEQKNEIGDGVDGRKRHRLRDGELIGLGAAKIPEENNGYRLLQIMGWSEGERIGVAASNGLEEPLTILLRRRRLGLGTPLKHKRKPLEIVPS